MLRMSSGVVDRELDCEMLASVGSEEQVIVRMPPIAKNGRGALTCRLDVPVRVLRDLADRIVEIALAPAYKRSVTVRTVFSI
jgi:hypothetical protein